MGLLKQLLQRLQRTNTTTNDEGDNQANLKDILFDWFNENNDSVSNFVHTFLEPCIAIYSADERTKKYLKDYPEKAYEDYFDQHAILCYYDTPQEWILKITNSAIENRVYIKFYGSNNNFDL